LELLAEAGNYAAVQRMLQTSPYWLSQYGGTTTALGAPGAPTTHPFDLYYRQAAAVLQKPAATTPLYPTPNRFNPLYLGSLSSLASSQQQLLVGSSGSTNTPPSPPQQYVNSSPTQQ